MNTVGTMYARRPLIGVAPSHDGERPMASTRYLDAVWRAGGLAVILAYTEDEARWAEYAALFDGFLFSGGVDVDPALYGDTTRLDSVEIDAARDTFEAGLFRAVYPTGKPILGICRGIQAINVFMGGTLHQHIEGHRQTVSGEERPQTVTVTEGGLLHRLCGKTSLAVNTFHHQAVKTLAPALAVDALCAEDGHIEAAHAPSHPFLLAVQFHPEIYNHREDDDHSRCIFEAFVGACSRTGSEREL